LDINSGMKERYFWCVVSGREDTGYSIMDDEIAQFDRDDRFL
jgi:hypothetical protein